MIGASRMRFVVAVVVCLGFSLMGMGPGKAPKLKRSKDFHFVAPAAGLLNGSGQVAFELVVPDGSDLTSLALELDGTPVAVTDLAASGDRVRGSLVGLDEGPHALLATLEDPKKIKKAKDAKPRKVKAQKKLKPARRIAARTHFEVAFLDRPEVCNVLNDIECLLPYPSSTFLTPAATPTGVRLDFPAEAMPPISGGSDIIAFINGARSRLDPTPYNRLDGFSPTVQILMHFPAGVDLEASKAARLLEATRNFDLGSLRKDSPSVLLDADTGERIAHFAENDARATGAFAARRMTILRPAQSLLPGHRYIVAMRRLVDAEGARVQPEAAFAALRDGRPTDIAGVAAQRDHFEEIFDTLELAGVKRHELVLAFDFVVQSDAGLTGQMLAMRDDAFSWLAGQDPASLFTVSQVEEVTPAEACEPGGVWKIVKGTFKAPLYLTPLGRGGVLPPPADPASPPRVADPIARPNTLGVLALDAGGLPVRTGFTMAPYGLALPCSAVLDGPAPGLIFGHGLFGSGPGTVDGLPGLVGGLLTALREQGLVPDDLAFDFATAGTNWSGLSSLEVPPLPDLDELPADLRDVLDDPELLAQVIVLLQSFIGQLFLDFNNFPAMPDRLRQGQLNTLVLGRMLKTGVFNVHTAFQTPGGGPAIASDEEMFYFGASLGGIMGLMFAALSPDVERANVDVPSINFSFLLPRAKPFKPLQAFLDVVDPDPLLQGLGIQLLHELWVRGESAGYAHHITGHTLPPLQGPLFATNTKRVLMTVALYDQQVANLGAQIAAATLGLPNLEGSVLTRLPLVPDAKGPLQGAHVVYDTGAYVLGLDDEFIPPLTNLTAPKDDNKCDPHALRGLIPASLRQLLAFLRPGGEIENFCNGACDAEGPLEIPFGQDAPCDPRSSEDFPPGS